MDMVSLSTAVSGSTAPAAPCGWSPGEQRRAVRVLIVWVCWVLFQDEGGSPGATAMLLTLAVYLVDGPTYKRRSARSLGKRLWPDALSSAENGGSAASLELTANLLRTGTLSSDLDTHANKVQQFFTPVAATRGAAAAAAAGTTAAAADYAATAAKTPQTPAGSAGQSSFEEAMTRLAGAAELGTEALIYVRRADVAEIVDVLMDHASSPVGPTVTSPALARLALVRRSRRRDLPNGSGRRACSPVPRGKRTLLTLRRLGSPAVDGSRVGGGGGRARQVASASPSSRTAAPALALSGGRALFQDSVTPPLRDVTSTNSSSTRVTFRARSPAQSPSGEAAGNGRGIGSMSAGARRVRCLQEGKQRRLRQRVRSPSPPSSAAVPICPAGCVVGTTPIALAKNSEALPAAGAGHVPTPSTKEKKRLLAAAPPVPLATKASENVAAACVTPATEGKIRYTPVQRTAGKREGQDFDDFWSSGMGRCTEDLERLVGMGVGLGAE
eukprot:g16121.t1